MKSSTKSVGSAAVLGTDAAAALIAAIAVGVLTGMLLEKIDSKVGATAALIKAYERMGIKLREIEYEIGWWLVKLRPVLRNWIV